ncbi:signal peptidase II [Roseivirga sp. E12]|uniref:signal peptidase II n=1 Tax=Roseivirga sp. E12 TaxID=2819237 RepID=UPI001ABD0130|nr:signal peptidase II [Roseivirga sp. E12]MBO3697438.1 signal peptidase II [Roseivirga sp. E12]
MKSIPRTALIIIIILANIAVDQVTKKMTRDRIEYNETIEVIGEYLILTKVENEGAFLGMGSSLSPTMRKVLLLILPAGVMIALFVYLIRNKEITSMSMVALSFIVGGGIGNVYDRIVYGSVTDMVFIDLQFAHTGIFNLADVSVMIGTGIILVEQFLPKKKNEAPAVQEEG